MAQPQGVTEDTRTRLLRLGDQARRDADRLEASKEARDAAIFEADAQGWKTRAIAREVGLDASSVLHIIARETARRQAASGE